MAIPHETLADCLSANKDLVRQAERLEEIEADVGALLLEGRPLPADKRAAARPVLGNIAEAIVESVLCELGWQPLQDDIEGISFGPGVDLMMLDPDMARVIAIEVKSTVQPARWPRLARGAAEQMTPDWLDQPRNTAMNELSVRSDDIFVMVVQVHFQRRLWRASIGPTAAEQSPITAEEDLTDLTWID